MIPKTRHPKAKDLRLIALTNVGYKLMMSVIRNSLEDRIIKNRLAKETQAGFTEKRIGNNIFLLNCIEKSFKMKKPLIVTSIDFAKAYDSINVTSGIRQGGCTVSTTLFKLITVLLKQCSRLKN